MSIPLHRKIIFSLITFTFFLGASYLGFITWRGYEWYRRIKNQEPPLISSGNMYAADPVLGYRPVPGSTGFHVLPIKPDVPIRFDADGFRVPMDKEPDVPAHIMRALVVGDSFTFGEACTAEETYAFLVGETLKWKTMNAGIGGYGLAQIVLRTKELLAVHKPDVLVFQYSTWITPRSKTFYSPVNPGVIPVPFMVENHNGEVEIKPPLFQAILFDLPVRRFINENKSIGDFIHFLARVMVPLRFHDDFLRLPPFIRHKLGLLPTAQDEVKMVAYAAKEVHAACRAMKISMVVVYLGPVPPEQRQKFESLGDVLIIDAEQPLLEHVAKTKKSYAELYFHWRGSPPVIVNEHPNALAHQLIAQKVSQELRKKSLTEKGVSY